MASPGSKILCPSCGIWCCFRGSRACRCPAGSHSSNKAVHALLPRPVNVGVDPVRTVDENHRAFCTPSRSLAWSTAGITRASDTGSSPARWHGDWRAGHRYRFLRGQPSRRALARLTLPLSGGDNPSCGATLCLDDVLTLDDPKGTLQAVWQITDHLRDLLPPALWKTLRLRKMKSRNS